MDGFALRIQTRTPDFLVDVALDAGNELISLLGRSGSGKTVVLRSVAGVYTPQHGLIELGDRIVFSSVQGVDIPPSERRVGWVPHVTTLFPNLSVADNVAFALKKQDTTSPETGRRRVREVLDMMQLIPQWDRLPAKLTTEQLQRVAFARALVIDPDILLLDDPFADLDISARRQARHEFQSLRAGINVPAILSTTDLEEAYEVSSRIALIDRGRILQYDPPRTLVMRPANRDVADLVLSVNIGRGLVVEAVEGGVMVQTRLGRLRAAGVYPLGIDVDMVIRPEHIQVLTPGGNEEYSDNILVGRMIEAERHDDFFELTFVPDTGGDPLRITMSDLAYREPTVDPSQQSRVRLPPQAIHLMASLPDTNATPTLGSDFEE